MSRDDRAPDTTAYTTFGLGWLRMLAGVAAAAVLACAITAPLLATSIDSRERRREAAVVSAALDEVRRELVDRVGSDANWDPAMLNLERRFSAQWAQQTFTSVAGDDVTTRLVMIVGPDGRALFTREHAAPVPADRTAEALGQASGLIGALRRDETARASASMGLARHLVGAWVTGSDILMLHGRPFLVVASLVGSDTGTVAPTQARAPIVMYWSDLGRHILPSLAQRLLLQDARIDDTSAPAGTDLVKLRSTSGALVATLSWTAEQPGMRLLVRALLPLCLVVSAFALTVLFAYRHAVKGSRALQTSQEEAHHLAFHDGLTGLPNRRLFNDRIAQALSRVGSRGGELAVLIMDLDRFKVVNDSYGHQCGDELIQAVARRLQNVCRTEDTCARLGGDEFVILSVETGATDAATLAKRISAVLALPVQISAGWVSAQASIGISISQGDSWGAVDLVRQADMALYKAKRQARGSFRFFELEMDHALLNRNNLGQELLQALIDGTLAVAYQPQFSRGRLTGVEALARWTHPTRGVIPPSFFIPLAEECGLIGRLSDFMLPRIFADSRRWPDLTVAINLSASQLHLPGFLDRLDACLLAEQVQPEHFEFEITESVLMVDEGPIQEALAQLRERGFHLALDDFGTGYSNLGYLSHFKIDRIKIDRSFVSGLSNEPRSASIVRAIVSLASAFDIDVVAEGVETASQMRELAELGCTTVQGFLTGQPVPCASIDQLLAEMPGRV